MVDREQLKAVLAHINVTGDFPVGGTDAAVLAEAAAAYLEIPDPNLVKLLNDLGETRAILMRNAQQNAGTKDGQILELMFNTVARAQEVIQQAMLRAQQ